MARRKEKPAQTSKSSCLIDETSLKRKMQRVHHKSPLYSPHVSSRDEDNTAAISEFSVTGKGFRQPLAEPLCRLEARSHGKLSPSPSLCK